jgi:hypothetical protein
MTQDLGGLADDRSFRTQSQSEGASNIQVDIHLGKQTSLNKSRLLRTRPERQAAMILTSVLWKRRRRCCLRPRSSLRSESPS